MPLQSFPLQSATGYTYSTSIHLASYCQTPCIGFKHQDPTGRALFSVQSRCTNEGHAISTRFQNKRLHKNKHQISNQSALSNANEQLNHIHNLHPHMYMKLSMSEALVLNMHEMVTLVLPPFWFAFLLGSLTVLDQDRGVAGLDVVCRDLCFDGSCRVSRKQC